MDADFGPSQIDMGSLLSQIENFLLPVSENQFLSSKVYFKHDHLSPKMRLDQILHQVSLADHIRTLQTIFRDSNDDLSLAKDLRFENVDIPLTNRHLTEKILEGRARIVVLSKLCFEDDSVEVLRSTIDLANTYALNGMWSQVTEHLNFSIEKLQNLENSSSESAFSQRETRITSRDAARRVDTTLRTLRKHALQYRGQINATVFLRELNTEFGKLSISYCQENLDKLKFTSEAVVHPSQLIVQLEEYFLKFPYLNPRIKSQLKAPLPLHPGQRDSMNQSFEEHVKLNDTKESSSSSSSSTSTSSSSSHLQEHEHDDGPFTPSWGDVLSFLRKCPLFQAWMNEIDKGILPQSKALLLLPFRQCDKQIRGIAHPMQLSSLLNYFPSSARTLAGTELTKKLSKMKEEICLLVNPSTGKICDIHSEQQEGPIIGYELPISWEEFLCMYVLEDLVDPIDLLWTSTLTLSAVSQIFSDKLSRAEENLRKSLKQLEVIGLEMEIVGCELYNAIAQLMIMKYRNWQSNKKSRCQQEAERWLHTPEGQEEYQSHFNRYKAKAQKTKSGLLFGTALLDVENKSKETTIKTHTKKLMKEEIDPTTKSVEAGFRYLIRSYEILEEVHGPYHPSVATACLAVASVKNMTQEYEIAREWLSKALRIMEKVNPLPERALAFIQIQLSQVLSNSNYEEESFILLSKAAQFYSQSSFHTLQVLYEKDSLPVSVLSPSHVDIPLDVSRDYTALHEDLRLALDLNGKIIHSLVKKEEYVQAAELSEQICRLTELSHGWDTMESADAHKHLAHRWFTAQDFSKSLHHYQCAADVVEILFGKEDKRWIDISRHIQHIYEIRNEEQN